MLKKSIFIIIALVVINGLLLGSDSHQAFFKAIKKGDIEKIRSCIENKPDLVHAKIVDDDTVLHLAVGIGGRNIVELLIKKGANVNAVNSYKQTPLHYAFYKKSKEMAALLLDNGAHINCRNVWGNTPFYRAVRSGYMEGIQFLIQRGADINLPSASGKSPLHAAVGRADVTIVDLLLKHGADINSRDTWKQTPLFIAASTKAVELVKLLTANGADIHQKNGWGQTVLHRAAIAGYLDIVDLLIDKGAEINKTDSKNRTPIDYAGIYGHEKVAYLLKTKGGKRTLKIQNFGLAPIKRFNLKNREAVVWYLGTSGWAIKTKNHLLIFDYYENTARPVDAKLINGYISPEEIKNLKVIVFVSHEHYDHFDKCILEWKKNIADIHYVFGWKALKNPVHHYMGFRKKIDLDTITIESVHSPKAGELEGNFLLTVDGLTIYHSGDYSRGHETFKKDMDYLASVAPRIDLFFMLAGNDMDNREAMIALDKVKPQNMFPMHSMGSEYVYKAFAESARKKGIKANIVCAQNRGDMFLYRHNRIQTVTTYEAIFAESANRKK